MVVDSKEYSITFPSVVLFSPHTPHSYYANGDFYVDDYFNFALQEEAELFSQLPFPTNTPFPITNDNEINEVLQHIAFWYNDKSKLSRPLLRHYIPLLMYYLATQWDFIEQKKTSLSQINELMSIRRLIQESPTTNWKVNDLIAMSNFSTSHFHYLYKQTFDTTCAQDIISTKIEYAKKLLSDLKLSISEVAKYSGYRSPEHFSRQFHLYTGLSPRAYRKNHLVSRN